ncbi:MAG: hypothetical protein ACI814_004900 [Mariniblastus sp.]|jgi:hypothetical protein
MVNATLMTFRFSAKTLLVGFVILSLLLACYSAMRFESLRQISLVADLVDRGGGHYDSEVDRNRLGFWLGLDFPAERVLAIEGIVQAEGLYTPGLHCDDNDIELLTRFINAQQIYIGESTLTNKAFTKLINCRSIERLVFLNCDLSECDFSILSRAPALRYLDLPGSKVDADSLREFIRNTPQCEVERHAQ